MRKQIFTLVLLGLVCSVGNVWGAVTLSVSNSSAVSETFADGTVLYSITSNGTLNSTTKFNGNVDIVSNGSKVKGAALVDKRFVIKVPVDVYSISITGYNSSTRTLNKIYTSTTMESGSYTEITSSTTKSSSSSTPNYNYTFVNSWSTPIAANTYIWFEFSNALDFYKIAYTTKQSSSCAFTAKAPSITIPATSTYNQAATTAAGYSGTITYALSNNTCGATIAGTTISVTQSGSVTVTATAPETATFDGSTASYTLTVADSRTAHGLAYSTTSVIKSLGDDDFTNTLTNEHSLTVTYSISNNGSGSTINTSTGAVTVGTKYGVETVTASFDGDETYQAGSASYTLNICDGGESGTIGDLEPISSDYTFIADFVTASGTVALKANYLYDNGHIFATKANGNKKDKGTSVIDGITYYNSINLNGTPVVFKVSAPCYATFYVGNNSGRSIKVGTADDDDKYGTAPNGTSPWSCYITEEATVYIRGTASSDYCLAGFKLKFSEPISTASGQVYSTYVTPFHLDFEGVSGITAYKITGVENGVVQMDALTTVPSGTPILIETTSAGSTINVPIASTTPDAITGNKLQVGANGVVSDESTYRYVLAVQDGVTGFYKLTSATDVPSTKAYLELTSVEAAQAPMLIRLVDEENNATDIKSTDANEIVVKFIQNGQLFIRRDGITYDALGRIVK